MPVGIDTNKFIKLESLKVHKVKNSVLFWEESRLRKMSIFL